MFSGEKLAELRHSKGFSQATLARQLGISRPSYHNWEKGKTVPNQRNWSRLAAILGVDQEDLEDSSDIVKVYRALTAEHRKETLDFAKDLLEQQSIRPLYAYRVYERLSAGTGFTYFNDGNYDEVFYDERLDHDFASWVFGDSMEPTYLNGDVVLIKQTGFDYDGAVYAVDWNGETYLKRVFREDDNLRLVSINQAYEDILVPLEDNPRIIGKIVGNFKPIAQ